jgi:biotin synthase
MQTFVDQLRDKHTLSAEGYRELLSCTDAEVVSYLHAEARKVSLSHFGNKIFIRGLIEISNCCRNDCLYCGIRKSNTKVERYRLDKATILKCCDKGYELGFRTFVLQGGEDPAENDDWVEDVVSSIHLLHPDCAITLSLGEKSKEAYERFFHAGADRYLLRHETFNASHYQALHPSGMSRDHRLQCLDWLKEIGYQIGTGMMVGSPGQKIDYLVEDIQYIEQLHPQMIGLGPFIPHHDTPFAKEPAGSVDMTLRLLSIFRLIDPYVLIPATTALATLDATGRERGILAGANVVMPNLSPGEDRKKYELYNDKAFLEAEAAEGLSLLRKQLADIGYEVAVDRGDYQHINNHQLKSIKRCTK